MLTELTKSVQSVQSDGMKTHTLIKASTAVSLLHTKGHQRNCLLYVTKIFISTHKLPICSKWLQHGVVLHIICGRTHDSFIKQMWLSFNIDIPCLNTMPKKEGYMHSNDVTPRQLCCHSATMECGPLINPRNVL